MTSRERFEAWFRAQLADASNSPHFIDWMMRREPDGTYYNPRTRWAWEGWQAREAHA